MAENTEISWTDATFNPWMGCTKVGPGCDHCYAETLMDTRHHKVQWGAGKPRVRTGEKNWNLPIRWNNRDFFECPACHWRGERRGVKVGTVDLHACPMCHERLHLTRRRVFCSSLADVFDNEVDPAWRADLFALIRATPNLDWLLLTKRIGNAPKMLPSDWYDHRPVGGSWDAAKITGYPNVWLGATIVNQEEADRDIPKLLQVPARVRFLSMEPLLGDVRLGASLQRSPSVAFNAGRVTADMPAWTRIGSTSIDWVIVGGESGHEARSMQPEWVRELRDQCAAAGVAFHFKQWGEWGPRSWADDTLERAGKKANGRMLDGATHNAFPEVS
jgi:protein gp37